MPKVLAHIGDFVVQRAIATIAAVALSAAALASAGCSSDGSSGSFVERDVPLVAYGLFDLGVVDADGNGLLDIFSSNHSGAQSLLLNRGDVDFDESFSVWGLDQDPAFPGLAVAAEPADTDGPGLYIDWRAPDIFVRAKDLDGGANGTVELLSPVELQDRKGFEVSIESTDLPSGATSTRLVFSGPANGYFAFTPVHHALPITFTVQEPASTARIFVGARAATPQASPFAVSMRDRHGMAWADFDGNRLKDLFITRGGLSGTIGTIPLEFFDELFVQGPAGEMMEVGRGRGLVKGNCPGRQAAWVDFDGDGLLDIYVACGRDASGEDADFRNQLFRQNQGGQFVDAAAGAGLDLQGEGKFLWLDIDEDADPDLLWVERNGVSWHENRGGRFEPHPIESAAGYDSVTSLGFADPDADGDLDILIVASERNDVLVRENGTYTVRAAAALGLPARSLAASWVDVDNDGIDEFFSVPGGIYRRGGDGRYSATGQLDFHNGRMSPFRLADAHAVWADLDNDGRRDLVLALNYVTKGGRLAKLESRLLGKWNPGEGALRGHWVQSIHLTRGFRNHWLDLELHGAAGSPEPIGAKIRVRGPGYDQTRYVGQAEASRYSQGHYRAYFGLGDVASIEEITVTWPDGREQTIRPPGVDRLLSVDQETR